MKKVLIVIGIIVVIVVLLGLFAPKNYTVARSVKIKASKEVVFAQLSLLNNFNNWSPWKDIDPNMVTTYEGTDGTPGAKSHWEGNDSVGTGTMELTRVVPNDTVETTVHFIEPWEATNQSMLTIGDSGDSLNVTWSFSGHNGFPTNIMGLFMNMDEMLGKDFEKGLNTLKKITEKQMTENKTYRGYQIIETEYAGGKFIAAKQVVKFADMGNFFGQSAQKIVTFMTKNNLAINGMTGLFYKWDDQTKETEAAFAAPFVSTKELKMDKGLEVIEVNPTKALKIEYRGGYEQSGEAHYAMDDYIKEKGLTQLAPMVEEYITDPMQEPDTTKWLTNIIYLVQ